MKFHLFNKKEDEDMFVKRLLIDKNQLNHHAETIIYFFNSSSKGGFDSKQNKLLVNAIFAYDQIYKKIYGNDQSIQTDFLKAVEKTYKESMRQRQIDKEVASLKRFLNS